MLRSFYLMLTLSLGLWAGNSFAQDNLRIEGSAATAQDLYEGEAVVNSQSAADRTPALGRALAQVLAKLTGDRNIGSRPSVAQELRNADSYVRSYDYRQGQGVGSTGAPTFQTTLVANFRRQDVDSLVEALGLPLWPQPRPKPVLWLAIDDGTGPRLVSLQQSSAVRPLLDRAVYRGYRLGLPEGSAAEQALVGAIWRQDTAAIARASARYSPPMQLVGKLYRAGNGWRTDWVFIDSGRVLSTWSVSDSDAMQAMRSGADGTADALIKQYAKAGEGAGPRGVYRLTFTNINSAESYIRLSGALQKMAVVSKITPVSAQNSQLVLDVDLLTGLRGFNRLLGANSPFTPAHVVTENDNDTDNLPREYRLK